ncbi:exopolyphosphatase/guanosine-5'-triphosphate,3'-diphosphate pyrophosphatase [Neobacillus niacini]|uniref:Ppx/GppA family phosphatase n=1 Tax=Neobacillus niacini TaxID=86668 RepID=UPI002787809A|nr:Ppx/GppA family phosphatase [Neobacillus niacini]MDQ1004964.1 exopolyphosphatase/guanosine-5'-triphosphate,3'-diphosphate pyrophosphatase [Neobacillus niacini]
MEKKIGVIDIGSNTIRLVIYEWTQSRRNFREIQNIKVTARLRSYLNSSQSLSDEGINLLIDTLQSFQTMIRHYELAEVICVATAAIRQSANREEILRILHEKTSFSINLLSEYEEAYYGYLSVIHSTNIKEGITIDMGGASTEITYFHDSKLVHYHSFPFGSLSLKLQFVAGSIPTAKEREQIRQFLLPYFQSLPWLRGKHIPVIAMGGSARNAARIHQNFIKYPLTGLHQYEMNKLELLEIKENLEDLSFTDLQKVEGLSKERSTTILPAFELFDILFNISGATKFVFSLKGLREGILYQKMNDENDDSLPLAEASMKELIQEFRIAPPTVNQLIKLAGLFYSQAASIVGEGTYFNEDDFELLMRGAQTFHLGRYGEEDSSSAAFYVLANRTIMGLSHRERVKLALVASYKGKGTFQKYLQPVKNWFSKEEQRKLCIIGAILKLAKSLDSTQKNVVEDFVITADGNSWNINIQCQKYFKFEEYQFEKQKKHLEKLLKISIISRFHLI